MTDIRITTHKDPIKPTVEAIEDLQRSIEYWAERCIKAEHEIERSLGYATRLLESFVSQHFPHNPDWKPLPDLLGVLTQLDNATTIARDYKAEIERLRVMYSDCIKDLREASE